MRFTIGPYNPRSIFVKWILNAVLLCFMWIVKAMNE